MRSASERGQVRRGPGSESEGCPGLRDRSSGEAVIREEEERPREESVRAGGRTSSFHPFWARDSASGTPLLSLLPFLPLIFFPLCLRFWHLSQCHSLPWAPSPASPFPPSCSAPGHGWRPLGHRDAHAPNPGSRRHVPISPRLRTKSRAPCCASCPHNAL